MFCCSAFDSGKKLLFFSDVNNETGDPLDDITENWVVMSKEGRNFKPLDIQPCLEEKKKNIGSEVIGKRNRPRPNFVSVLFVFFSFFLEKIKFQKCV